MIAFSFVLPAPQAVLDASCSEWSMVYIQSQINRMAPK